MGKWPKVVPTLSEEQRRVRDDFVRYWHEQLPRRYGVYRALQPRLGSPAAATGAYLWRSEQGWASTIRWASLCIDHYVALELRDEMAGGNYERHTLR